MRHQRHLQYRGRASCTQGDHACCIYATDAELVDVVGEFIADGLQRGERCWYVAAGREEVLVVAELRRRGVDVASATQRRAFSLIPSREAYPVQNTFEPEESMRVFSDAIEEALRDGFTGFRAAAEMSWALGPDGPTEALIVYEALLRTLFSSARVTGLCLYPRAMPLDVINGVLATHPLAATRGPIETNPFYDARIRAVGQPGDAVVLSHLAQLDGRVSDVRD